VGWFSKILGLEKRETVNLGHPRDPVLRDWFVGSTTETGEYVSPDSAMSVTAVYAATSLIAETISALPLHVYKAEEKGATTSKAYEHPLYPIVHDMVRPGLTSFEWREGAAMNVALRGDSMAEIVVDGRGRVTRLNPMPPDSVRIMATSSGLPAYEWQRNAKDTVVLRDDQVLRIPFKMLDGLRSITPIEVHRNTIGLALASRRYLNSFYRNSAQPKGAIKIPPALSDEAVSALRTAWERRHMGPENAGRIAILDGGMEWAAMGMTMEDAQYVELSGLSTTDIARIFRVPPHKIGDLSKATFSNIEHQAIEFVTDCVLPWCRRFETRMTAYLLSEQDRAAGYYISFDLKGLLRGDASARGALYRELFNIGAITANEIRRAEDLNPYADGDVHFVQGALVPVSRAIQDPPPEQTSPPAEEIINDGD
jgi:HK97 family phage portal protein